MKVIVTGSSSGIGLSLAKLLHDKGHEVYGISKSISLENCFKKQFIADVRDGHALKNCFDEIGGFHSLICCAGIGLASAVEQTDMDKARDVFDVNFFGMADCVRQALASIADKGKIILVSSMAGVTPVPFNAYYNASKAAIIAFAVSLNYEVEQRGIHVTAVLPGGTRTDLSFKREKGVSPDLETDLKLNAAIENLTKTEQEGRTPQDVAQRIEKLLHDPDPAPVVPIGIENKAAYFAEKLLPKSISSMMVNKKFFDIKRDTQEGDYTN